MLVVSDFSFFPTGLPANVNVAVFPGLVESIDAKDYTNGLKWAGIIEQCLAQAIKSLE